MMLIFIDHNDLGHMFTFTYYPLSIVFWQFFILFFIYFISPTYKYIYVGVVMFIHIHTYIERVYED